jgi:2-polyprenyl-3-methyl-5-hydroxy-6-metoxy-1,4-benzoquinol methylase
MRLQLILDNPLVWTATRTVFDRLFGLYRKRLDIMEGWGVLGDHASVLDIGCGIGQYARMPASQYTGIDLNARYIDYARRRSRNPRCSFRCVDGRVLLHEESRFDVVLMVDFLHHLPDDDCIGLLRVASRIATRAVLSFEPVVQQPNPLGQWVIDHDRGRFVRPLVELHRLFLRAGLRIDRQQSLMLGPVRTEALLCRPAEGSASWDRAVGA